MEKSLLSWDSLDDDQPLKSAANQDIALKAAASLQQLDTTEAENEMQEQADNLKMQKSLQGIGALANEMAEVHNNVLTNSSNSIHQPIVADLVGAEKHMQRALASLDAFKDKFETGARIEAKHKRLINSKMDANQLVPFKYTWAWSMYLESTEAHWMPAEAVGYLQDEQEWKSDRLTTSERNLVRRLCVNYMYASYIFSPDMLVNLYRVITSPEARQYILRQAFEEQAYHHSVRHVVEVFDMNKDDILALQIDEMTFKERDSILRPLLAPLGDLSMSTESNEDIGNLLCHIATVYVGLKVLTHLVPLFQIVKFSGINQKMTGVAQNLSWVLRDINRQFDFGIRLFNGIVEENPEAFTGDVKNRIVDMLVKLVANNEDLLSTLVVDSSDLVQGSYASKWLAGHFLRSVGIEIPDKLKCRVDVSESSDWFVDYFLGLNNHKDHGKAEVSLSGEGGSLDWG